MRNVDRPKKPPSLCRNATRWRKELLAALSSTKQDRELINRRFNRYNKEDIRTALKEMYGGLCCYCESKIGVVSFYNIEHRKPKKHYPEYTFEWDNLHLVCQMCNTYKSDKWCDTNPILDSARDNIQDHLSYKNVGRIRWPKSHRGTTTIDHAQLNRQGLLDDRLEIALPIMDAIHDLNDDPHSPNAGLARAQLKEKASGKYGSLINWLITSYLQDPGASDP